MSKPRVSKPTFGWVRSPQKPVAIPARPTLKYSYSIKTASLADNPCGVSRAKHLSPLANLAQSHDSQKEVRHTPEFAETLQHIRESDFPLTSAEVLKRYQHALSSQERSEIKQYPTIYCLNLHSAERTGVDSHGYYKAAAGDHLAYRYEVVQILGRGTFGQVFKCYDHRSHQLVAVKVLKHDSDCERLAVWELKAYEALNANADQHNIIKLLNHFVFRSHICMVFELLSESLYDYTVKRGPLTSIHRLRSLTRQLLVALRHVHDRQMAHADIRPENVLFTDRSMRSVKLIDFGTVVMFDQPLYTYVQTREYRAPEIVLGCEYGSGIDLWSLGCVLFELHTGNVLFDARDEQELVSQMIRMVGPPPSKLVRESKRDRLFFQRRLAVQRARSAEREQGPGILGSVLANVDTEFKDFLMQLLCWDPKVRLSAEKALQHPWLSRSSRLSITSRLSPPVSKRVSGKLSK